MNNLKKQLEQKIVKASENRMFHWNDYKKTGFENSLVLSRQEYGKEQAYRDILQLLKDNK